jgi:hypothetical protein
MDVSRILIIGSISGVSHVMANAGPRQRAGTLMMTVRMRWMWRFRGTMDAGSEGFFTCERWSNVTDDGGDEYQSPTGNDSERI